MEKELKEVWIVTIGSWHTVFKRDKKGVSRTRVGDFRTIKEAYEVRNNLLSDK